jgi:hypothetical protein
MRVETIKYYWPWLYDNIKHIFSELNIIFIIKFLKN